MPGYVQPHEVPGTVFVGKLLELARDLIENPDDNPEYTRGILELLHDATGESMDELRGIMFPNHSPLMRYAIEVTGGTPEDVADWQRVAEELYEELHPTTEPADRED
ncbi:MAG: hypothetical protein ACJ780_10230 [Solirubrobacteraceae bacterium]